MSPLILIAAAWLTPPIVVAVKLVHEMRKPDPESDLERRLREDREVAALDAVWYAPAFTDFRAGEYMDRLSRIALGD